jgi:ribosome-associated protein
MMQIRRPKSRQARNAASQPAQRVVPLNIAVRDEYITLGQLLKVAGIIGSGGEAKVYLADTVVQVNGEPEQRRGRKLRPGDLIAAPGERPILLSTAGNIDEENEGNEKNKEIEENERALSEGDEE